MKKLLLLLLFIPLYSISQKPTVISYSRFFPKNDKLAEFEKALKNHATKFHTGDWKWRVYTIESGPDAGGYLTIEGPSTWDQVDKRGDLGADHMNDLFKNLLPLTTERNSLGYLSFREDLSTVKLTDYSDKIAINHIFPKPGKSMAAEEIAKMYKKVWEEAKQSIAVYEASSSGPLQLAIVTRYKEGLKERDPDFRKPLKERYNAIYGEGAFDKYLSAVAESVDQQWSELLFLNADLSSK